ncbi:MAG: hypothetical protein M3133_07390 [Actinomycetota bacterium]|nr:hypothetical protein [Actinomycetota bacterium]
MRTRRAVLGIVLAFALVSGACGDDVDTEATRDTVAETAEDAREAAENAFAELRTQGERLVDEVRTTNAPEAKEQLLDRCRDALERLRRAESDRADQVDSLCNRIRDADVENDARWGEIKDELSRLNPN